LPAGVEHGLEASRRAISSGHEHIGGFVLREHRFEGRNGFFERRRLLLELVGLGGFCRQSLFRNLELFLQFLQTLVSSSDSTFPEAQVAISDLLLLARLLEGFAELSG
jgi:hypothetical protein